MNLTSTGNFLSVPHGDESVMLVSCDGDGAMALTCLLALESALSLGLDSPCIFSISTTRGFGPSSKCECECECECEFEWVRNSESERSGRWKRCVGDKRRLEGVK